MVKTIKIFDPNNKPYGILSNNFMFPMDMVPYQDENKKKQTTEILRYNSVSSYIYSNMLTTPTYKNTIRNQTAKTLREQQTTISQLYKKYEKEEINDIIRKELNNALSQYIFNSKNQDDLQEILLKTGNSNLVYISMDNNDELLGIGGYGKGGKGENIVGTLLMQIRNQIQNKNINEQINKTKQEEENSIWNAYTVYKKLEKLIKKGTSDLNEYRDKPIDDLKVDLEQTIQTNKDVFFNNIYNPKEYQFLSDSLIDPNILIIKLRAENLEKLRKKLQYEENKMYFDLYANYTLRKDYDNVNPDQYGEARNQELSNIDINTRSQIIKDVKNLYEKGMLSENLSQEIDISLKDINNLLPTEDDIKKAKDEYKKFVVNRNQNVNTINNTSYNLDKNNYLTIYEDVANNDIFNKDLKVFSLHYSNNLINIDNKNYPTISHYIFSKLLERLHHINVGYDYILANISQSDSGPGRFFEINRVKNIYEDELKNHNNKKLKLLARIAMDKKFKETSRALDFQDLLLATGNNIILWDDRNDVILGVGKDGKGENFVGKHLTNLREEFRNKRQSEPALDIKDIFNLIDNEPFLKSWVQMRVNDICKTVNNIKNYLYRKNKNEIEITPNFVSSVLDNIYQPCSFIYKNADRVEIEAPYYFIKMVRRCNGFIKVDDEVINIIWKRISVMLWYLSEYIKTSSISNIKQVLAKIEYLVSTQDVCYKVLDNDLDNCIVSAILNIISGMIIFNREFSQNKEIGKLEVEVASSIILDKDFREEFKRDKSDSQRKEQDNVFPQQFQIFEDEVQDGEDDEDDDEEDREVHDEEDREVQDGEDGEDDEEDGEDEEDYGEDEEDYGEDGDKISEFPGGINKLSEILENMKNDIENNDTESFKKYLKMAIERINSVKMSNMLKKNRINFFATQRN